MIRDLVLIGFIFVVVLKYFGSPRGVFSKNLLTESIKMEHHEIVTSVLTELREKKKTLTSEEYRIAATHAFKVIKAQYKLLVEYLERESA
jgi:hypothetical protein